MLAFSVSFWRKIDVANRWNDNLWKRHCYVKSLHRKHLRRTTTFSSGERGTYRFVPAPWVMWRIHFKESRLQECQLEVCSVHVIHYSVCIRRGILVAILDSIFLNGVRNTRSNRAGPPALSTSRRSQRTWQPAKLLPRFFRSMVYNLTRWIRSRRCTGHWSTEIWNSLYPAGKSSSMMTGIFCYGN